ncbi:MAG: hypothetical protein ABI679_16790, partial [Gemmatimonadota bacterium]
MTLESILRLTAAWLLTYLLHSTLLLLAATVVCRRIPGRPRGAEMVWRTALFGALLTSSIRWSGALSGAPASNLAELTSPLMGVTRTLRLTAITDVFSLLGTSASGLMVVAWLMGAVIGIALLVRTWLALRSRVRPGTPLAHSRSREMWRLLPSGTRIVLADGAR